MLGTEMPPATLRNSDVVYVESMHEGATAHRPGCSAFKFTHFGFAVTTVEAWVFLHAQWCPTCMGRRG